MNILIVDDSFSWQKFNKEAIKRILDYDYNLTICDCANSAYDELLKKTPFDLILSDLQMEDSFYPLTAGEWFITQVQNMPEYNDTKIVIISAMYNIQFIAEKLGVDFVRKPYFVNSLLPLALLLESYGYKIKKDIIE